MKSDYVLFASVLLLAIGLGFIFRFTHGTVNFSAAVPVSGASLHVAITTAGLPAMVGVPLTVLGLLLLIASVIIAIARQVPALGKA